MTTCRPDIACTSIKLPQSNSAPAKHHYHGLKRTIRYIYVTRNNGIYIWRTRPSPDLMDGPLPTINSNACNLLLDNWPNHEASIAIAYSNSDWATCVKTHRLFSGICIVAPWPTKQNSNRQLPYYHLPKWSLWLPATLAVCSSTFAASYGTLMSCKRMPPLHTKITMAVLPWAMHRSLQHALSISMSNTLPYVIGLNATSSTSKGSTPPSILLIILPNHSPGPYSSASLISDYGTFLQNTPRYTSMQSLHTTIVFM
jgi:hypothetical protein